MYSQSFKDVEVWKRAHQLALDIYKLTKNFPNEEKYGVVSQIRRSAVSVAANIAEGFLKKGLADKKRFYNISQGSLSETQYYLVLIKDLNYADTVDLGKSADVVGKMLYRYMNSF